MHIDILTIFPEMFEGPFSHSIIKRAIAKGIAEIRITNIRDYSLSRHKNVDDYPYGGGGGMVMMAEPISRAIESLQKEGAYDEIIYMSPDGQTIDQALCNHYSTFKRLMILCGHYKGVDERVREKYITRELSIGDYVLSGGELAAAVFSDALIRLIPGVLNDETSALSDSFQNKLLSPPVYTRPAVYQGMKVPDVLLSGNDKLIYEWRMEQAIKRTSERRPDLLDKG